MKLSKNAKDKKNDDSVVTSIRLSKKVMEYIKLHDINLSKTINDEFLKIIESKKDKSVSS